MKKYGIWLFSILLTLPFLTACNAADNGGAAGKLHIVTTIFPEYDWVREIIGTENETIQLTLLADNGVDLHSYQPSAQDIIEISTCDVLITVGGASDSWVTEAIRNGQNPKQQVLSLMDILGESVKVEEFVEGMEAEDEEAAEQELEYDEHVWLSVKNAELFCESIANTLCELDKENAATYQANLEAYRTRLEELDDAYTATVETAPNRVVLFADRFPFRYLTDDYGLRYYAAFAGCSAETEASFSTIALLAKELDEWQMHSILTIDNGNTALAETVRENTRTQDQQILTMHSMQNVTREQIAQGMTYLSVMEQNLNVLQQVLLG